MSDERKMDYGQVEAMIDALHQASNKLHEVQQQITAMANKVQTDQILAGAAGDSLTHGLNSALSPAIQRLAEKLTERANFLAQEEQTWKAAIGGDVPSYQG